LPRKTDSRNPSDWLWIAEEDLLLVQAVVDREAAFQAARSKLAEVLEKVLKAELIRSGWPLEKTHDLLRLRDALIQHDASLAEQVKALCNELAEAYFTSRYPGFDLDDPDWPVLRRQMAEVQGLLGAVKERIAPKPEK